jgi:hypothetical protein
MELILTDTLIHENTVETQTCSRLFMAIPIPVDSKCMSQLYMTIMKYLRPVTYKVKESLLKICNWTWAGVGRA